MLITTKKWAKRPLQKYLVEYRFHPMVNQRVNFGVSLEMTQSRDFLSNYRSQPFKTNAPKAAASPNAVLYSRLERYCENENGPGKRRVRCGKKRGTLDL